MKTTVKLLAVCFFALLNSIAVCGQEKSIERSEFESVTEQAEQKRAEKTHRATTVSVKYADRNSAPTVIFKKAIISVVPDRLHTILETDGKIEELIIIGSDRYYRENGGKWKKDPNSGIGSGSGSGQELISESYKAAKNVELNGKKLTLYESLKKAKSYISSRQSGIDILTQKYWISADGLLIKEEFLNESDSEPSFTKLTTVYEYDSKIKIKAPIR